MTHQFTVIGYYPDNDQPWSVCVTAENWKAAIQASREHISEDCSVVVCAVLEGDHRSADNLNETVEIFSLHSTADRNVKSMLQQMRDMRKNAAGTQEEKA